MKVLACGSVVALLAAIPTTVTASQLNPCTLLTVDEIKSAFGRTGLSAGKFIRESDDLEVCLFAASGVAGDVVVMLPRMSMNAKDFDLLKDISVEHVKRAETVSGVGDGAFYYDDQLDFRVGNRMVTLLVARTPRTEPPAAVKAALTRLAMRIADRLRATR